MSCIRLRNLFCGDEKEISIGSYVRGTEEARNPVSATFLVLDPDRTIRGEATSGSATTLVDPSLAGYADGLFVGVPLRVFSGSEAYETEVTGFEGGTLTFRAVPVEVSSGTPYEIMGFPVLPLTDAALAGNKGQVRVGPSDVTATPGRRVLIYRADFGDDALEARAEFSVLPSR